MHERTPLSIHFISKPTSAVPVAGSGTDGVPSTSSARTPPRAALDRETMRVSPFHNPFTGHLVALGAIARGAPAQE